jgi:D-alanyl-D-alanine carboxypeptidase/D-alanyl-D-alanine-endopeptidase (penicillin-binding protein 4)
MAASARYLGIPYASDPLGEAAGVDPDPLYNRRRVDCVTFVEQALAEALAPGPSAVLPTLQRLRYRGGEVAFTRRNHHFVADWIPNNAWIVADITDRVGGSTVRRMTKRIDRAALFRARGESGGILPLPEEKTTTYIPRQEAPAVLSRLPALAIVVFVQDRPGIFAAHTGFLLRKQAVVLRHASQRRRRVMDEPLKAYLARAPARIVGIKVLALRAASGAPPAARPAARPAPPRGVSARRTSRASALAARRHSALSP